MKTTVKALPIILYPYIYMICLAGCFAVFAGSADQSRAFTAILIVLAVVAVICNLYSFVLAFFLLHGARKGKYPAEELAKLNMIVKLSHIPAYILHFCLGLVGLLMSIWGLPLILWAVFIDFVTILLSGIVGVGACISGKRETALYPWQTVLFSLLGFVYCADVVVSILLYIIVKRKTDRRRSAAPVC